MSDEIFLNTMLSVGTTDTTLLHASMEALNSLEVFAVDVCLTEFQFATSLDCNVQIFCED